MELSNILDLIEEQLLDIMSSDPEFYGRHKIILSNEQQFIKEKDKHPNSIFIVVKFLSGNFNYGQYVQPVTVLALAEKNKFEVCQKLLNEYVSRWHNSETREAGNDLIKQTYTSPAIMSNFNEVGEGYRSLMYLSGIFLVGENSNPVEKIEWFNNETNEYEQIPVLTSTWTWSALLEPQSFYSLKGRTKSETRTATFTLSFTLFHKNDAFGNIILDLPCSDDDETINPDFKFKLTWKSGKNKIVIMKCVDFSGTQNIGEFPVLNISFTR